MKPCFVFGSNLLGHHGGGAARHAIEHCGAIWGRGEGMQGDSYALPTMDESLRPLTLDQVREHVGIFLAFAQVNPQLTFHVTAVGCGIAGFKREDIIPIFKNAPANCFFFEPEFGQRVPAVAGPGKVAAE